MDDTDNDLKRDIDTAMDEGEWLPYLALQRLFNSPIKLLRCLFR